MTVQTSPSTPPAGGEPSGPPTAARPGTSIIVDDQLVSTSPGTGAEIGRFPVADQLAVAAAVARARGAAGWWQELGFDGRRQRLLRWRAAMTRRVRELLDLMHDEGGKPTADALVEFFVAVDQIAWSSRNAKRVLRSRRVRGNLSLPEFGGRLEYQPFGVVGVIGPWNYPILTPVGSITYALAAGNTVVFKPSEYSPAVGRWYVERFAEIVPEHPVLEIVYGGGETGGHLVRAGVDKVAFTGSPRTARKIMAACAETLTPVLIEGGGKDAMIVDSDANLDAAAEACVFGAMTNAGQTCVGIERAYVVAPVYDAFVDRVVQRASKLTVGLAPGADIGPMTMPSQLDIIARHIDDALAKGGRAVLGGRDAVQPPFAMPTVLVDVPEDALAVKEETFGPTVTIAKVADVEEALARANSSSYGLGGSVFGKARAVSIARRMRSGMVSINGALSFAGIPALPFGGVGDSGFGRIHGDDGLREFARPKSIAKRRMRSFVPSATFERGPKDVRRIERIVRLMHGR
jgi:acyl-CoA reductase-like NAD-dependent aldehyde dehydrogenase